MTAHVKIARANAILPEQMPQRLTIVSGGQSGVDRAALDAAIARGIPYGGWCPKGGWAEDFPDPPRVLARYPLLQETPSADPAQRTEWNMRDSDACLILVDGSGVAVSQGTALTGDLAARYAKPLLVVDVSAADAVERMTAWLVALLAARASDASFRVMIGGPRESEAPGIYGRARGALGQLLAVHRFGVVYLCHDPVVAEFRDPQGLGRRAIKRVAWARFRHGHRSVVGAQRGEIVERPQPVEKRRAAQA